MKNKIWSQYLLFAAWLIALVAMIITLYASEILTLAVCPLCWYQRICIYPLALILAIATYRNDADIAIYAAPLALIGAIFALYQYLEQMIPGFAPIRLCGIGIDCAAMHLHLLGFITYPFLSLIACLAIAILLLTAKRISYS